MKKNVILIIILLCSGVTNSFSQAYIGSQFTVKIESAENIVGWMGGSFDRARGAYQLYITNDWHDGDIRFHVGKNNQGRSKPHYALLRGRNDDPVHYFYHTDRGWTRL